MAVLNFPASPNNGDTYVENGVTYTYSGTAPNGFWQADNQNVAPTPDPNITVTGALTVDSESGTGNAVAFLASDGQVKRGDASTSLVGPFALKAGDTFVGNVILSANSRLGVGTASPVSAINAEGIRPEITLTNTSTGETGVTFKSSTGGNDGKLVYNCTSDKLEIYTGDITGLPELVLDSTGKLGLGNNFPEAALEVRDDRGLQIAKADGASKWRFTPTAELSLTEEVTGNDIFKIQSDGKIGLGGAPDPLNNYNLLSVFGKGIAIDKGTGTESGIVFTNGEQQKAKLLYDYSASEVQIETNGSDVRINNVGSIGVRTTAPSAPLHVKGQVKVEDSPITLVDGSDIVNIEHDYIGSTTNSPFSLRTNNADRLTVLSNGNVTATSAASNPTFLFQSTGTGNSKAAAAFTVKSSATATNRTASLSLNADGGDVSSPGTFKISQDGNQDVFFEQDGGNNISFKFQNTDVAHLSSSGNVIVGGTVGATNGNKLTIDDTSQSGLSLITDGSVGGQLGHPEGRRFGCDVELNSSNNLIIRNNELNKNIEFIGDYSTLMTLVNASSLRQQVVIGGSTHWNEDENVLLTVGDAGKNVSGVELRGSNSQAIKFTETNNPTDDFSELFHAPSQGFAFKTSTSSPEKFRIRENGRIETYTTAPNAAFDIGTNRAASSTEILITANSSITSTGSGGVNVMKIYTNGDVQNTNNNYGALSDRKLKKNIENASSQWDDIKAIQLKNYEFKNPLMGTDRYLGVIAQDLVTISPGLVSETEDVVVNDTPVFDENGNPVFDSDGNQETERVEQKTGETTMSVKYSVLYLKALGALQEAMTRIEDLETRINALES